MVKETGVDPMLIKGIGFDATCSLAVLNEDTDVPISVNGPDFKDTERNVIREHPKYTQFTSKNKSDKIV